MLTRKFDCRHVAIYGVSHITMIYSLIGISTGVVVPAIICKLFDIKVTESAGIIRVPGPGMYVYIAGFFFLTALGIGMDIARYP